MAESPPKSTDRRHDFGASLLPSKCCKCRGVTWNRGDEKTGDRYCLKCYNIAFPEVGNEPSNAEDAKAADAATDAAPTTPAKAKEPSEEPAPEEPAAEAAAETTVSKGVKLHVKNLDDAITTETLSALFAPHGTVQKTDVKVDKDGKPRGFGQVVMSTKEEAENAIAALNDTKQGEKVMGVVFPPVPEKAKGEQKGQKGDKGKGKGKGKDEKGKGKGKGGKASAPPAYQQQYAYPASAGPAIPDWMMENMGQMDPVAAQIWQQQMYTMQLYAHMSQQQEPQPQASTEKGKGKKGAGKGKVKDAGTKVDGTFRGKLKSINFREDKGYGFIDCDEAKATYGRDVYVSSLHVPEGASVGDQFEFNITLDQRGQLRATNVKSTA